MAYLNRYFNFSDQNRPINAVIGDEITIDATEYIPEVHSVADLVLTIDKALLPEIIPGRRHVLKIVVDFRDEYPKCVKLKGYVMFEREKYRATVTMHYTNTQYDGIVLIPTC